MKVTSGFGVEVYYHEDHYGSCIVIGAGPRSAAIDFDQLLTGNFEDFKHALDASPTPRELRIAVGLLNRVLL